MRVRGLTGWIAMLVAVFLIGIISLLTSGPWTFVDLAPGVVLKAAPSPKGHGMQVDELPAAAATGEAPQRAKDSANASTFELERQRFKQARNRRAYIHDALISPTAEKLFFAQRAVEECHLHGTYQAIGRETRSQVLASAWAAAWDERTTRCTASGGIDTSQLLAIRHLRGRFEGELPAAALKNKFNADELQLERINALKDVGLAISWGAGAVDRNRFLLFGYEPADTLAVRYFAPTAWAVAICERHQCDDYESAQLCFRGGFCQQEGYSAQVKAMVLADGRVTEGQWLELQEIMARRVRELLW